MTWIKVYKLKIFNVPRWQKANPHIDGFNCDIVNGTQIYESSKLMYRPIVAQKNICDSFRNPKATVIKILKLVNKFFDKPKFGDEVHIFLHFLDKTLVLARSSIFKCSRMPSMKLHGKSLIRSMWSSCLTFLLMRVIRELEIQAKRVNTRNKRVK